MDHPAFGHGEGDSDLLALGHGHRHSVSPHDPLSGLDLVGPWSQEGEREPSRRVCLGGSCAISRKGYIGVRDRRTVAVQDFPGDRTTMANDQDKTRSVLPRAKDEVFHPSNPVRGLRL